MPPFYFWYPARWRYSDFTNNLSKIGKNTQKVTTSPSGKPRWFTVVQITKTDRVHTGIQKNYCSHLSECFSVHSAVNNLRIGKPFKFEIIWAGWSLFGFQFVLISRKIYRNDGERLVWGAASVRNNLDWQNIARHSKLLFCAKKIPICSPNRAAPFSSPLTRYITVSFCLTICFSTCVARFHWIAFICILFLFCFHSELLLVVIAK